MENNPKKSKAFIIAFILILLLLIIGYYLYTNKAKIFDAKGDTTFGKIFTPLLGTSKNKDLALIIDPNENTNTTTGTSITGIINTDENGNKIVRAEAGEDLKKGDVLYVSGFNGNKDPIVMKAIANDKDKSIVFGVAGEDMIKGKMGNIIIEGILTGMPTNRNEGTPWARDNTLYLSDKIYGGMTKNPPLSPSFVVPVGSVISIDPTNGSIRIGKIGNNGNRNNNGFTLNPINLPHSGGPSSGGSTDNRENPTRPECSDGDDNDGDGAIDQLDSGCHEGGDMSNAYVRDHDSESTPPPYKDVIPVINSCTLIDKNPLIFTEEEQARLGVLLRKFYLVSSTLKTAEDITTIYNEIEQQKTFTGQVIDLTKQCYLQTNDVPGYTDFCKRNQSLCSTKDKMNTLYTSAGNVKHGNPWYTKANNGTYPYTSDNFGYIDPSIISAGGNCEAISGYYYGMGEDLSGLEYDCSAHNNFAGYGSCTPPKSPNVPNPAYLDHGCKWKDGINFSNTERILNIW